MGEDLTHIRLEKIEERLEAQDKRTGDLARCSQANSRSTITLARAVSRLYWLVLAEALVILLVALVVVAK